MMKKTFLIALSILTLTSSLNAFASTLDDNVIEDLEKFHIVEKSDDLRPLRRLRTSSPKGRAFGKEMKFCVDCQGLSL